MRVRTRVDGILQDTLVTSNKPHNALVSRIKIMGELNISEKRLPQDGRILVVVDGRDIDLRVATMPSTQGEKVVLRILDRSSLVEGIHNLGFSKENEAKFHRISKRQHGMMFVTGPTGSGKTTTLYTILESLKDSSKNILTIEDPVEFDIDGITQTQVNSKAGLTFASGLRGFMRSDPDIIMVGEVRDEETAEVATNAALTGHLVLSTLHTNDSVGTISRLTEMGLKSYIISSSLSGVIAQRLVRKVCKHCKKEYECDEEESLLLSIEIGTKLYKGTGCDACNHTGYKGRTGVFEVLEVTKNIRNLISKNATVDEITEQAIKEGLVTLMQDAISKVLVGETTTKELLRAIG